MNRFKKLSRNILYTAQMITEGLVRLLPKIAFIMQFFDGLF